MPIIIGRPNGTGSGEGASGATPEQLARIEAVETDNSSIKDRLSTLESTSPVDYSPQIQDLQNTTTEQATSIGELTSKDVTQDDRLTAVESKNTTQDTRLNAAETALTLKADLVGGKVPMGQLPDIPVGRKLNVANRAARLALSSYADITIAYESDTGDAYALDANQDPAIDANWSKLGNALGIGVASFNGRTGNISAQANDYTTSQITEVLTKQFVTQAQKDDWSSRETTSGAQTKATAAQNASKMYADNTFIPLSQRAVINGVAPLDAQGKVPLVNLPSGVGEWVKPTTVYTDVKSSRIAGTWYLNNLEYDKSVQVWMNTAVGVAVSYIEVRNNTTNQIFKIDSQSVGGGSGNNVSNQSIFAVVPSGFSYRLIIGGSRVVDVWLELNQTAGSTFTPISQKGVANGVASLDSTAKIPVSQLPTNLPTAQRIWRDVKATRIVDSYITHTGGNGNEMMVYVRSANSTSVTRHIVAIVRESASGPIFLFRSDAYGAAGDRWQHLYLHVPHGWQYSIRSDGGSTTANIELWYEMY